MKSFFNILQKCANSPIIKYPDDKSSYVFSNHIWETNKTNSTIIKWNKNINNEIIKMNDTYFISCYIYNIICKIYKEYKAILNKDKKTIFKFSSAKLKVFKMIITDDIQTDFLFLKKYKKQLVDIFSKAQKIYHLFIRFTHIYRVKKYKIVVTDDLSLTPLDINHRNTFILIQNRSKYLFSLNDLVKIIETAITNAPYFFQEPNFAKNPYNNEVFNYSTLYNIYFQLKSSYRIMSTAFHLYFLSDFNLDKFILKHEAFLRDITIQNYIYNTQNSILHKSILAMLKQNFYTNKLAIHDDFPKDLLVDIFKPFLYYYLIVHYDIQGTQRIRIYKKILYLKLKKFYFYNKTFGRKISHYKPKLSSISRTNWIPFSFITHHIPFHMIHVRDTDEDDDEDEDDENIYLNTNANANANANTNTNTNTNTNANTNANTNTNTMTTNNIDATSSDENNNQNSEDNNQNSDDENTVEENNNIEHTELINDESSVDEIIDGYDSY